jgi:hypothetical protein
MIHANLHSLEVRTGVGVDLAVGHLPAALLASYCFSEWRRRKPLPIRFYFVNIKHGWLI